VRKGKGEARFLRPADKREKGERNGSGFPLKLLSGKGLLISLITALKKGEKIRSLSLYFFEKEGRGKGKEEREE